MTRKHDVATAGPPRHVASPPIGPRSSLLSAPATRSQRRSLPATGPHVARPAGSPETATSSFIRTCGSQPRFPTREDHPARPPPVSSSRTWSSGPRPPSEPPGEIVRPRSRAHRLRTRPSTPGREPRRRARHLAIHRVGGRRLPPAARRARAARRGGGWTHGLPPQSPPSASPRSAVPAGTTSAPAGGTTGETRCPSQALRLTGRRGSREPEPVDNALGRTAAGFGRRTRPRRRGRVDAWLDQPPHKTASASPRTGRGDRHLRSGVTGLAARPGRPRAAPRRTVRPQPVREAWSTGAEVAGAPWQTRRPPPADDKSPLIPASLSTPLPRLPFAPLSVAPSGGVLVALGSVQYLVEASYRLPIERPLWRC